MPNTDGVFSRTDLPVRATLLLLVMASGLALAGCTSNGSDGTAATVGPDRKTSTAPATSISPTTSATTLSHANPLAYHPVSKKQARKIERAAVRAPGVQNVAYIPGTATVDMYMTKTATTKQRVIANAVVNQVLHPAATPASSKTKHH